MAVPKYEEMYRPFLEALKDGQPHSKQEIKQVLRKNMQISDEDVKAIMTNGVTVYENRVSWAQVWLKKAGLIDSTEKNIFVITEKGKEALAKNPKIDNELLKIWGAFSSISGYSAESVETDQVPSGTETPDEAIQNALQQINFKLDGEIFSKIKDLKPLKFEKMVVDFFSKIMGYGTHEDAGITTSKTNDGGIDGIIKRDKLGIDLIYVQVKKIDVGNTVGSPGIRDFVGAINKKKGNGLFVTTAKFSKEAIGYAKENHIILVDGEALVQLMREHNFGVTVHDTFYIKKIDANIFDEYLE